MASAEARALKSELGPEARAAMSAEERAASEALAAERAAVSQGATHSAAQAAAVGGKTSSLISSFHSSPTEFTQSVREANQVANSGRQTLKSENPATVASRDKSELAGATRGAQAAAEAKMESKFSLPSGKTLAGLGLSAFCAYAIVTFYSTDGKTINIKNVKIIDSTKVQITYDPPSSIGFSLQVNDTLDFSGAASGCVVPALGSGVQIVQVIDSNNCVVEAAVTSVGGVTGYSPVSAGAPVSSPTPSCSNWGTATAHSSLANQFVGAVTNTAAAVCGAAAGTANSVINAAAPVAENLINTAAPVAANLIHTGANLGGQAFCGIVPFLCDPKIGWIIGGICLCIIISVVAFKVSKQK
jgi:hypothetical protein